VVVSVDESYCRVLQFLYLSASDGCILVHDDALFQTLYVAICYLHIIGIAFVSYSRDC